jgi:hypothetical protein
LLYRGQSGVIVGGAHGISVIPATQVYLRNIGQLGVMGLGAQSNLPPVFIEGLVAPYLQQV